jgi:hypothetical protein
MRKRRSSRPSLVVTSSKQRLHAKNASASRDAERALSDPADLPPRRGVALSSASISLMPRAKTTAAD